MDDALACKADEDTAEADTSIPDTDDPDELRSALAASHQQRRLELTRTEVRPFPAPEPLPRLT